MGKRTEKILERLEDLSDRDLISRAQQGNSQAFDTLVMRHQDRIYNAAYRFTGHAEDASDVVQQTFLSAYRAIGDFKGDSAFLTWLYRIAFNQSVSLRRSAPRAKHVALESAPEDELAHTASPDSRMESQDLQQKIQTALATLSEEDRKIIILKDLNGCSYQEIADILGVPAQILRSKVFRARMELKKRLAPLEVM